jgi:transcriptional regulator with XRE-family HTH domain
MLQEMETKTRRNRKAGVSKVDKYATWFGARLREALGSRPQVDIANLIAEGGEEVKPGRISHYMQGRRYPDPPILKEMARALGVSADWLLGLTEQPLPVADLEEMLAQAKGESHINKLLKMLPPEKQQQVIDYTEFLVTRESESGDRLTQRQRDTLRAERAIALVEKEFGEIVRIQLEKIIRTQGLGPNNGRSA